VEITRPEEVGRFLGVGALALGVFALALVWFAAWVYLIEVFTRDLYLIRVVSGVDGFRPFSATFYIIISVVTVWFLYFYWLAHGSGCLHGQRNSRLQRTAGNLESGRPRKV
jgi:fatty acid desaturase